MIRALVTAGFLSIAALVMLSPFILPGIDVESQTGTLLYVAVTTMIIISVVLSLIFWLLCLRTRTRK